MTDPEAPAGLVGHTATALGQAGINFVRRWNRLEVTQDHELPDTPTMFVANHGFGGIFDLNVGAVLATFQAIELNRPVTILTHQIAWTLGVGRLVEAMGARPASRAAAQEALAGGKHVLVFPGGD